MVTMHGFFDLKDETSEPEFHRAMDDIVGRLKECELISSHKVLRRSPKENYDSNPPSTKYYIGYLVPDWLACSIRQTEAAPQDSAALTTTFRLAIPIGVNFHPIVANQPDQVLQE